MTGERQDAAARLIGVFVDVDRLRVIGRLLDGGQTATSLASTLGSKPQTILRHLQILEDAGLAIRCVESPYRYRFNELALRNYAAELGTRAPDAFAVETNEDARILRSFVVDGRIIRLPAQRSRWLVLLGWIVERFDYDRNYSEPEVNEILAELHDDYALLRRQLVDERFMARDHGVYCRLVPEQVNAPEPE